MLNVLGQLLDFIDQHIVWLYGACLVVILLYLRSYLVARQESKNTTFTIEREVAIHREGRAMTGIGIMLGIIVFLTATKFYIVPSVDLAALMPPTPTNTLPIPTVWEPTPTLTPVSTPEPVGAQPLPTAVSQPTIAPTQPPVTPTEAAPPPTEPPARPAACGDPNVSIVSPGMDATVSGVVAIIGTATHPQFQFYKVEYASGDEPGAWSVIGDVRRSPVVNGQLATMDTRILPNGTAWFRLTVVDQTGNYPNPCRVRVNVQN